MNKNSGFTLLEILIALAIFAVLAVLTAVGLRSVIDAHQKVKQVNAALNNVLIVTTRLRRDLSQMIDRPIVDKNGATLQSFFTQDKNSLEFTRAGYTNPHGVLPRSSLLRVKYQFTHHQLIRFTWAHLDRLHHDVQTREVLLDHVASLYLNYVTATGNVLDAWSTNTQSVANYVITHGSGSEDNARQQALFPRAVIFTFKLDMLGALKLVIPIRGRGDA